MRRVVVLELNELNFEMLERYVERGDLPHFKSFFDLHGYRETTSEVRYAELEPWIQWVTAHTGKSFAEHGIFRLGDTVSSSMIQIWEQLESECGIRVGAVSPMNAPNRLRKAAFFVPDPWTPTPASGSWLLRRLSGAVSQAVNDNASGRMTVPTILSLVVGILRYARVKNYPTYLGLVANVFKSPWNKVRFLELFLGDLFIRLNRSTKPQFSTLFLNGGAHLQHHYMFNSVVLDAPARNPDWYVKPGADPVGDMYRTYDRLLGSVMHELRDCRILLMTGLHQDPYPNPIFYWRLRNHEDFLRRLNCNFSAVSPRMSRDFIVAFNSRPDLEKAMEILQTAKIGNEPAFKMEARGHDIFVELVYPHDIAAGAQLTAGDVTIENFANHVAFVALKNGHHNGTGYFSDSAQVSHQSLPPIKLTDVHTTILNMFGGGSASRLDDAGTDSQTDETIERVSV